jgi:hypothetical protein
MSFPFKGGFFVSAHQIPQPETAFHAPATDNNTKREAASWQPLFQFWTANRPTRQ